MRNFFVYILTNHSRTLYIGMTNDLARRLYEHKEKLVPGFTSDYNIDQLVFYEEFVDVTKAIAREKQLKGWRREKKIHLIEQKNPHWEDLSGVLAGSRCHERSAPHYPPDPSTARATSASLRMTGVCNCP